jgi:peptide/nickel transport system substrate-binding protein
MKHMNRFLLAGYLLVVLFLMNSCTSDAPREIPWTRSGNEIVIRFPSEPGGLNPVIHIGDAYAGQVNRHIFQHLYNIDPISGKLSPHLANAMPLIELVSSDSGEEQVKFTIEIREQAVWDDGSPVTAEDVIFTYKCVFNPKVPAQRIRPYLNFISDITVDERNPKRFTIHTKNRYIMSEEALGGSIPIMPAYMFDPQGLMAGIPLSDLLSPERIKLLDEDERIRAFADQFTGDRYSRDTTTMTGSGPYRLLRWESGQRMVLRKKENWWGERLAAKEPLLRAYPDQITYQIIRDQTAAATLVKGEEVDLGYMLDVNDFIEIRESPRMQELYNFYTPSTHQFNLIYINLRKPILQDKRVRRALAHLLDIDAVIDNAFQGLAERLVTPVHPSKDYFNQALKPLEFSADKAHKLLTEAGWEDTNGNGILDKVIDGKRVELKVGLLVSPSKASETISAIYKEQARKAGIELEVLTREFSSWREEMNARNYDLALGAFTSQPLLDDFSQLWHTENDRPDGSNRMGFGTPDTDNLIETINRTLDKPQRDILYRRFQEIVYEEQPVIFLASTQARVIVHKRFKSFASVVNPGYFPHMYQLDKD